MLRLIDLMCDRHRTLVLDARIWPDDCTISGHFGSYLDCRDCGNQRILGHGLDIAEQAAFHEAGHAVMYTRAGVAVEYAHLDPTQRESGHVRFSGSMSADELFSGAFGGLAANLHWLDRMRMLDDAAVVDMVAAAGGDFEFTRQQVRDFDARDVARVIDLAAEHWPSIERVADALLGAGRLSGAEIAALAGISCNA